MTADVRYLKFALFADPSSGEPSFPRDLKDSLEAQGHTVFWFDPDLHPYAYAREGSIRGYMVRRFFQVQKLDCVILADGLTIDYPEAMHEAAGAPVGFLCENEHQAERLLGWLEEGEGWKPDFAITLSDEAAEVLEGAGSFDRLYDLAAPTEDNVRRFMGDIRADFSLKGCENPRNIAFVFGYIGTDNFANNHILDTIDERLRSRVEGSSLIAISMNPQHTLEHRGIYPLTMDDKHTLDAALAYASAVMVIANVLNDQGVWWGMGKAELFSDMSGCSLYAMSALATLAHLNDAKMVFYGGGAGPLELGDSKKLLGLMVKLGATFISRDEGTTDVLLAVGVPDAAISLGAEPSMLGSSKKTEFVDKWLAERQIDPATDQLLAVTLRSGDGFAPDFPQQVARAFKAALENNPRLRVVLCAMDPGDSNLLDAVKVAIGNPERVNIFHAGANADALSDLLSRAYAGFSMQYYGTLVLMRSGVPCMGVACQAKESALFAEVGCEGLSLDGSTSEEEMLATLQELLENRDAWAARVSEGTQAITARALASEDYVVQQMREIGAAKAYGIERDPYPYDRSYCERKHEQEVENLKARIREAEDERDNTYRQMAGGEYKLGRALTAIPRKLGLMKDGEEG